MPSTPRLARGYKRSKKPLASDRIAAFHESLTFGKFSSHHSACLCSVLVQESRYKNLKQFRTQRQRRLHLWTKLVHPHYLLAQLGVC